MDSDKLNFSLEVIEAVNQLCQLAFDVKSKNEIENILGLSSSHLRQVVQQLIDKVPDLFLKKAAREKIGEIRDICAREILFFQIQEKGNQAHYEEDLKDFIFIFSRDIKDRIRAIIKEESLQ